MSAPEATELRQRKTPSQPAVAGPPVTSPQKSGGAGGLVLKLSFLIVVFAALGWSYLATGERTFSPRALSAYDGSNEDLPVYISIDGDVYDVSANRRVYGKGGAYNMMAGRDASRSFITGCFETHLTHDLRGLTDEELKSLETWKSFFKDSPRYPRVGRAKLPKIDPNSPVPEPCANPKTAH